MTMIHGNSGVTGVASNPGASTDASDAPQRALLPEPAATTLGGDTMTALAMLITRADDQDRAACRAVEDTASGAAIAQENQRVAQLMAKADQDAAQGLESGVGDIAGGVATSASGLLPDGSSAAAKGEQDASGTNWRSFAEGLGKSMPGVGAIVSSGSRAEGDRDDARAAGFEAGAQMALRQYDGARSEAEAADASVQKVQQFLQACLQTEGESRASAASMLKA